jgi:DNA end-binding protein Ku
MEGGLAPHGTHTLHEQRDVNDTKAIFGGATAIRTDPEMVALARQLIGRQTTVYDPSDLEGWYEAR